MTDKFGSFSVSPGEQPHEHQEKNHSEVLEQSKILDQNEVLQTTQSALASLKHDILNTTKESGINQHDTQILDTLLTDLTKNPALEESKAETQTLIDTISSGNLIQAVQSIFQYITNLLKPHNKNNTFWFRDTQEIHTFISTLTQQRDQLSLTDLEQYRDRLRTMITSTSGTKRKLGLTYALSRVLDELIWISDPTKGWMKGESGGTNNKSANEITLARMAQSIEPGDILAVNKSEQQLPDKLLTQLSDNDLDTSHVLIVTAVDRDTGEITVAHSTSSKLNSTGSGVETNVSLNDYCNQFHGITIAALNPPTTQRAQLLHNIQKKDGGQYDHMAAASTALLNKNITQNNDKYNCVELIAQSFPDDTAQEMKTWTHPSQFLQRLEPKYLTMAGKSIGGS